MNEENIQQGRMAELERMGEFDVYEAKPAAQAAKDGPIISARWVDRPKDGAVRSRLVARDFAVSKGRRRLRSHPRS
eukprot:10791045-Alexandrium_andersonii.AAC.1